MSILQFIKNNTAPKVAICAFIALLLLVLIVVPFPLFVAFACFVLFAILIVVMFSAAASSIEKYDEEKRWGGRK